MVRGTMKVYSSVQNHVPLLFFLNSVMGRRRKTRTHVEKAISEDPKSFIIKHGPVGASVTQLVRDFRKVMEPNTASRLRVCLVQCRGRF